ncbi:glycosyltransferase family 2 protein [Falsihalocynthiibacter sp. SS001]|uniref:glycosyltransferase family 2 protein n=1 Tax=Falsihalocynthiibacter sp. SS001 TaxID=3349698 RepID=UPI0036D21811
MRAPATSVIIVSRERPDALVRCLIGVSQLDHPDYEVIVVADPAGLNAIATLPFAAQLKQIAFDKANISEARNLGLGAAAGDIVAFIDDDAVPEPSWLSRLAAPFLESDVAAAGGYVRGRNGISFQWRANSVDSAGRLRPLQVPSRNSVIFSPQGAQAIKTEGTNCAFRRDILANLGGFDPVFRYYFDDTDVNMRLAIEGYSTEIVPLAQVHHAYAASACRTAERAPKTLFEVGRSTALFQRKYADPFDADMAWRVEVIEQRKRLLRHLQRGTLEPHSVRRLMKTLTDGYEEGKHLALQKPKPIPASKEPMRKFVAAPYRHKALAGRFWSRRRLREEAAKLVQQGYRVTLVLLSPTTLYHRVRFTNEGFWEQSGGVFGRSGRDQPLFQPYNFKSRARDEISRSNLFREL